MQNPNTSFSFDPDIHYVVDWDAALSFKEFFDPKADLPERHLIISRIYQNSLQKTRNEGSDHGISANELSFLLYELIKNGKKTQNGDAEEYELGNLHVIFDYQDHPYKGKAIAGEHIKETIMLAEYWNKQPTVKRVVILTNDPMMQISAQDRPHLEICMFSPAPYSGYRRVNNEDAISYWRKNKKMPLGMFQELLPDAEPLKPHEFVLFGKTNAFSHIGRYDARKDKIVPLSYYRKLRDITPISELQAMAFEALMAPADEIGVVILYGNAGSGKTFAAVAAALEQTGLANAKFADAPSSDTPDSGRTNGKRGRKAKQHDDNSVVPICIDDDEDFPYRGIVICPPDRELGAVLPPVPGDIRKKFAGKTSPYRDAIRNYLRARRDKMPGGVLLTERDISARAQFILGQFEICPSGEINGRSFWNTFFICDEAQFSSLSEIKRDIERCDFRTKLALCGDPSQITNPFDWFGNALARAVRYLGNDTSVAVIRFDGEENIERPGAKIIARSWPRQL